MGKPHFSDEFSHGSGDIFTLADHTDHSVGADQTDREQFVGHPGPMLRKGARQAGLLAYQPKTAITA